MGANDKQVDGQHYQNAFQHWDYVEMTGMGYLEACASKYVVRWRKKNGITDLKKASHYIEKLIEEVETRGRRNRSLYGTKAMLDTFTDSHDLNDLEHYIISILTFWDCTGVLRGAQHAIDRMINDSAASL